MNTLDGIDFDIVMVKLDLMEAKKLKSQKICHSGLCGIYNKYSQTVVDHCELRMHNMFGFMVLQYIALIFGYSFLVILYYNCFQDAVNSSPASSHSSNANLMNFLLFA